MTFYFSRRVTTNFDIIMSENAVAQLGTGIVFCSSLHFSARKYSSLVGNFQECL